MTLWCFYLQIFEKAIGKEVVGEFLGHLLPHLAGPPLIIWDPFPAHRNWLVWDSVQSLYGRIAIEYLPACRPELNLAEIPLWRLDAPRVVEHVFAGSLTPQ